MKTLIYTLLISLCALTTSTNANEKSPLVYINKHIGFNIEGYQYDQPALPCEVDKQLVELLEKRGNQSNLAMEVVESKEKVKNGTVPVVLVDIEQLVLSENHNYGTDTNYNLPKIQITAGLLQGSDVQTAKHTCVIATTSSPISLPTDKIVFDHPAATNEVCMRAQACIDDLSKDVIEWVKPQIK